MASSSVAVTVTDRAMETEVKAHLGQEKGSVAY